jgi:hypothetical protein
MQALYNAELASSKLSDLHCGFTALYSSLLSFISRALKHEQRCVEILQTCHSGVHPVLADDVSRRGHDCTGIEDAMNLVPEHIFRAVKQLHTMKEKVTVIYMTECRSLGCYAVWLRH